MYRFHSGRWFMYASASTNSPNWMNWVAGTLPCAFGEQGDVPMRWQPASGSGNTRPRAWYSASVLATGVAAAVAGASSATSAAAAINPDRTAPDLSRLPHTLMRGYPILWRLAPVGVVQ